MHFCTKNYINKEICLMLNIYSSLTVVLLLILHIFTTEKKNAFLNVCNLVLRLFVNHNSLKTIRF